MDPQANPLGLNLDLKHALLNGLRNSFWLVWKSVGLAFVTALLVYSITYTLLYRRARRRAVEMTDNDKRDINEIAAVAGVGCALVVQARQYIWQTFGWWTVGLAVALAVGYVVLLAWAKRRDARLGKRRAEAPRR